MEQKTDDINMKQTKHRTSIMSSTPAWSTNEHQSTDVKHNNVDTKRHERRRPGNVSETQMLPPLLFLALALDCLSPDSPAVAVCTLFLDL